MLNFYGGFIIYEMRGHKIQFIDNGITFQFVVLQTTCNIFFLQGIEELEILGKKYKFDSLEIIVSNQLDEEQRAWHVKRATTQGEEMKREFSSTPEEAFESSNEGLYYGRQMVEARKQGSIRSVYHDANVSVHTAWDLGYNDQQPYDFFSNVVKKFTCLNIMKIMEKL